MDRDPIVFAWRSAKRRHAAAIAVALGLGGPLVGLGLLALRDLVDELLALAEPGRGPIHFLHLVVPLPERLGGHGLTLMRGWPLPESALTLWALGALILVALALAGLGWGVARLCVRAQAEAVRRLREVAEDAILRSGPAARDDARALAGQVGAAIRAADGLLAVGILVPALAAGSVLLALAVAAAVAPRLVAAAGISLVAAALARQLLIARTERRDDQRRLEGAALERGLTDLVRRLPAVRAHGTTAFEHARLGHVAERARRALTETENDLSRARAPALALAVLVPTVMLAAALWQAPAPAAPVSAGGLSAVLGALAIASSAVAAFLRQSRRRRAALPAFREIARATASLEARARAPRRLRSQSEPLPDGGPIVLANVAAYDPASGERLIGLDLSLPMPSHVAILGDRGSGSRVLAALIAGQLEPTAGAVTYAGTDLRSVEPAERARRIAYAGGEPVLMSGTLLQNLLYGDPAFADGSSPDASTPNARELEERLVEALSVTGLDRLVYGRGLASVLPRRLDAATAAAIVETRDALRAALAADHAAHLIEPFDPARYNRQATVGENILFGAPVGSAFSEARLAGHPFTRAVLEAEGLTRPMTEMGLAIARATVEIFSDLPDDHPLFDAFSLFPARERGFFEDLIARQPEASGWRRGPAGQRDRARLIGLCLRYSETRHRFGLIDEAMEARLVAARRTFAALLPASLTGSVEFYDPGKVTAAASLEENLLFGRVAGAEAGAGARVRTLMQAVLRERGLERTVYRFGLASQVDPRAAESGLAGRDGFTPFERTAIDVARCLVRRPDILVVGLALDDRGAPEVMAGIERLRAARAGRGLVVCLPAECRPDEAAPFDVVLRAERTTVVRAGGMPDVAETAVAESGPFGPPAGAEAVPSSEVVSSSTEPVRDRTRLTPD
ncbi:ATP-binding cassette domain-containing protein [Methylobacterium indicum]|uniref:ATP-binding cassette domain-containing protein n=1 Tax=Methylobacterium indicum TaxID=1775910 RepID=UPI0024351D1D|nr:ATP-binding cassette domain-containing protein [Methylobacterium indicum]